jgi:hypothetical protein
MTRELVSRKLCLVVLLACAAWVAGSALCGKLLCSDIDPASLQQVDLVEYPGAAGRHARISHARWFGGEYVEAIRGPYVGGPGDFDFSEILLPRSQDEKPDRQRCETILGRLDELQRDSVIEVSCAWSFGWPWYFATVLDVRGYHAMNSSMAAEAFLAPPFRSSATERYVSVQWNWLSILACLGLCGCGLGIRWVLLCLRDLWNRSQRIRCGNCGYSRTGLVSSFCPECGSQLSPHCDQPGAA